MEALVDSAQVKTDTVVGWRGLPMECTVAQLATAFGCAKSTIYRNIYRGDGDDPFKMGAWKNHGRFYIDRLEAADWFHRPMREAFKALIEVACGETTPVLWVPKGSHEN